MSNPLDDLKKLRGGVEKPQPDRVETDSIPVQDLGGKVPTPSEVFEYFQVGDRSDKQPDGNEWPMHALPTKWNKRKLPDYRPGKVKKYTKQEIEDYEKQRDAEG
jgi:hypothetical protein